MSQLEWDNSFYSLCSSPHFMNFIEVSVNWNKTEYATRCSVVSRRCVAFLSLPLSDMNITRTLWTLILSQLWWLRIIKNCHGDKWWREYGQIYLVHWLTVIIIPNPVLCNSITQCNLQSQAEIIFCRVDKLHDKNSLPAAQTAVLVWEVEYQGNC